MFLFTDPMAVSMAGWKFFGKSLEQQLRVATVFSKAFFPIEALQNTTTSEPATPAKLRPVRKAPTRVKSAAKTTPSARTRSVRKTAAPKTSADAATLAQTDAPDSAIKGTESPKAVSATGKATISQETKTKVAARPAPKTATQAPKVTSKATVNATKSPAAAVKSQPRASVVDQDPAKPKQSPNRRTRRAPSAPPSIPGTLKK